MSESKKSVENKSDINIVKDNKTIDPVAVGLFIAQNRDRHNLTQEQLASKIFISRKTVSKWETGKGLPSIELLRPLCEELNISLDELLKGEFINKKFETGSGISSRILNSPKFKLSVVIIGILSLFLILCFLIIHLHDTRVYSINYEDENFTIENGMIVFSNIDCFISLGNFQSDLIDNHDLHFKLYSGTFDESSDNNLLLSFKDGNYVYFDSETCKSLGNNLKSKSGKSLLLKISYIDTSGLETYFKIDLTNSIHRNLNLADVHTDLKETTAFRDKLKLEKNENLLPASSVDDEKVLDSINVEFLFKMTPKELKDCYDGKTIEIDGEKYSISYDSDVNILETSLFKLYFNNKCFVYSDDILNNIMINESFDIIFNNKNENYFYSVLQIMNGLRNC